MSINVSRLMLASLLLFVAAGCDSGVNDDAFAGPWGTNVVTAADLVKELGSADKPTVVCTAPPVMFRAAHIPGAVLHGPTMTPAVTSELVAWAKTLPKETSLVIYCGCCPLDHCPNLRPAYVALKDLGLKRVRVLILPNDFGTDWVRLGFPVER